MGVFFVSIFKIQLYLKSGYAGLFFPFLFFSPVFKNQIRLYSKSGYAGLFFFTVSIRWIQTYPKSGYAGLFFLKVFLIVFFSVFKKWIHSSPPLPPPPHTPPPHYQNVSENRIHTWQTWPPWPGRAGQIFRPLSRKSAKKN